MDKEKKEEIDYIYEKKLELFRGIYNYLDSELNSQSLNLTQQIFKWFGEYLKDSFDNFPTYFDVTIKE